MTFCRHQGNIIIEMPLLKCGEAVETVFTKAWGISCMWRRVIGVAGTSRVEMAAHAPRRISHHASVCEMATARAGRAMASRGLI